jgi:hypothetical protein
MNHMIISTVDGFRRAGLVHTIAGREYGPDDITPEQLAACRAEPRLLVVEIPERAVATEGPEAARPKKRAAKDDG